MRLLIADDHALFRASLRSLLEANDYEVVAEASDGREAVDLTLELKPEVVLMDLTMPRMSGLDATRAISAELPETHVVVLTASDDDASVFAAIKSGARGYLLKNLMAEDFFAVLDSLAEGHPLLTPSMARRVRGDFSGAGTLDTPMVEALTEREDQVLDLMIHGVTSNRDLAEHLGVSENTVKFHIRHIFEKLHLNNRAQVVAFALQAGHGSPKEQEDS